VKPEEIPGEVWRENAEILAEIEPTAEQLDFFLESERQRFNKNLAEIDFGGFAPKKT
jgi:hypothetical protein